MAITAQMRTDVANLYVALFGRAPERDGLGYWVNQLDAGKTVAQIAQDMYNTDPARAYYPTFLTNEEVISRFYTNVLGRTADADGLAYWTAKLNAGASKGSVIGEMITAVTAYAGTDAAAVASKALFENKVTVGLYYAVDLGGNNVTVASNLLATVTADAASVTAAKAAASGQTGTSAALTTGIDNVLGASGADTFTALSGTSNTADTLNTADVIDGGAGTDTLNITATGTAFQGVATIKNVEVINVADVVGQTFNAALVSGATNVNFTNTISGQTSTVSGLTDLATVVGISGEGNLTVGYNAGTIGGTSDTAKVSVDGIGNKSSTGTITRGTVNVSNANAIEKVAIAATGDNYISLTGGTALGTVTVTGAGSLNLRATGGAALTGETTNNTLTVDASAATGAQNYLFGAGAVTVKGGSAADSFDFGTTLGSTDSVDGGAGSDTLSFELGTAVQVLPTVANVETLAAKFSAGGIVNASKATGVTTLSTEVTDSTAVTYTNLASSVATLNFNKENNTNTTASGAVSISYVSGAKAAVAMNIGEQNSTTATADTINLGATTFANVDTLTITSVRDADNTTSVTNTLTSLDVGTATKVTVVTGDKAALTTGALTGASVTNLTVTADGGAANVGAFIGAALTDLSVTSANKAAVTTGALGQGNNATTASKLVNYSVTTGAETTVDLGAIDAANLSTASAGSASALKSVSYNLGDKATVTNIGAIDASDENGAGTNKGSGVAQLDTVAFKLGADAVTGAVTVGAISARSVTSATFEVAAQTSAHTTAATLNMDESIGTATIAAGKNETFTLNIDGLNDNAGTDLYTLNVGSVTGSGAGNVALAIGATATTVKSVGTIDLSGVEGTSEVVFSNSLTGTTGVTITVGSGGTSATGVAGSSNADIITGGKGADVLLGGAGADQVTAGLGADTVTGGTGNDTIDLTESTSSVDRVRYSEGGSTNVDTVTGFKAGTDIVQFDKTDTAFGNVALESAGGTDVGAAGAATAATVAVDTSAAVADATNLLIFSSAAATSFGTAIGTAVITDTTDTNWTNNTGIAAVYYDSNNGQAVFGYIVDSAGTGTAITSADTFVEVTRVGMTTADYTVANVSASFAFF